MKKLLVLFIALCLLLTLLVGCSGTETPESEPESTNSEAESEEASTPNFFPESSEEASEPEFSEEGGESTTATQQGGQTTTQGANNNATTKPQNNATTTTTSQNTTTTTNVISDFVYDYMNDLPEIKVENKTVTFLNTNPIEPDDVLLAKYGVNVKAIVVNGDALLTRFVALVNNGNSPDIYFNNYNTKVIVNGYVQAWDNHVDFKQDMWKGYDKDMFAIGGKHYYLNFESDPEGMMVYNKELFEEYDVPDPDELFRQGKWDWDAYLAAVKKLTIDEDRDGVPEIYGTGSGFGAHPWMVASGTEFTSIKNGKGVNKINDPGIARAAAAFSDVVATGGLYIGADDIDKFRKGEIAMRLEIAYGTLYDEEIQKGIKEGRFWFTANPRDPKSNVTYSSGSTYGLYLTKDAQNIPGAVAYVTVRRFRAQNAAFIKEQREENIKEKPDTLCWEYYNQIDYIKSKVTTVQDAWLHMGGEMMKVWTDSGTALLKGQSWSQIVAEQSPIIDAILKNFNDTSVT